MDSILQSIKKLLGPTEDYTHFDADIILHINSAFASLQQLGATWQEYLGDEKTLEFVKTYIYLRVRMLFDPPTMGSVMEAMKEALRETEWRITVAAEEIKASKNEET